MTAPVVMAAVAFNLLFNAIGSFLLAAGLASLAAWSLRVPAGRWRQVFLLLPLVKVSWDLVHGIPDDSFLWAKIAGARQDVGEFQLGVGVSTFGPVIRLALGAMRSGLKYPQSAAELAATGLFRKLGPGAPAGVAGAALAVSLGLLLARAGRVVRAALAAAEHRRTARVVDQRFLRGVAVDLVVADDYEGVPFLGGVSRPFVCFSRLVHESLTDPERDAVVKHELGHLAHRDLLLFAVVSLFADLFWFVPLLRGRCQAVLGEAEVCADRAALAAGASAPALASALVRVAELARSPVAPALGFVRGEPLLSRRVRALLETREERARPRAVVWRLAATALIVATILNSTAFGNR